MFFWRHFYSILQSPDIAQGVHVGKAIEDIGKP